MDKRSYPARRSVLRGALLAVGAALVEVPAAEVARATTGMPITSKTQDPAAAKTKYYDSFVLFQGGKKETLNGVAYHKREPKDETLPRATQRDGVGNPTRLSGASRLIPTVAAKNQTGATAVTGIQGGYSSMSLTGDADYKIGALIETDLLDVDANNNPTAVGSGDPDHSHRSIGFHRFYIAWILNI